LKKKVLITGGAGFIGSSLSLELIKRDYKVTVMDNLSEQIHGNDPSKSSLYNKIKGKVNFVKGDVRSKEDWIKALQGQEIVIHLAAETGTGQSMYKIEWYTDVNIKGTSILLDILTNEKSINVKKLIVASSRSIYGEGKYKCGSHGIVYPGERSENDMLKGDFMVKCPICRRDCVALPTDEDSKIHPSSVYGLSKQVQEEMCMIVGKSISVPVVVFRYQNVFGPGQSLSNPYTGILSIFSTRIFNGNSINVFEDGEESRDFVYIDDVVEASILGMEKEEANFRIYNVGSGKKISVNDVVSKLLEQYNIEAKIDISGNFRLGDIRHNYADLTKIEEELGYKPKVSFEEGIKNFCKWVNSQEIKKDEYSKSFQEMKDKGLLK